MKIDPYKHKERYQKWKEKILGKNIEGLSKINSDLIKQYIFDMEKGINISSKNKKGGRSHNRLNTCRQKLTQIIGFLENRGISDIRKIQRQELFKLFSDMRSGVLKNQKGKEYKSTGDYVKDFKAFWNWWIKINRLKEPSIIIQNITEDLNRKDEKPKWVYLKEEEVKKLCDNARYDYRVLIWFLFDSGIRSPSELINIKVSDFYNDFKELNIRDEISKTFGRKIKLILCSNLLREYVKNKGFEEEDFLFQINPCAVNQYLQRLSGKLFGNKKSLAGEFYSKLTMYDFRHCSCCYWLPRYKQESALKYRFGWKSSDKIHYYSELLGMKDTITPEDLFVFKDKTEIEMKLEKSEREKVLLQEKFEGIQREMLEIIEETKLISEKVNLIERRKMNNGRK